MQEQLCTVCGRTEQNNWHFPGHRFAPVFSRTLRSFSYCHHNSICLSVCRLSVFCSLTLVFFTQRVEQYFAPHCSLWLGCEENSAKIFASIPPQENFMYKEGMKNCDFRPVSLYIGNDTRYGHSYNGRCLGTYLIYY